MVVYNDSIRAQDIIDAIEDVGFGATLLDTSDEPSVPVAVASRVPNSLRKLVLGVEGMTCSSCSSTVESYLCGVDGVLSASVILATNKGILEYDATKVDPVRLLTGLEHIGFGGSVDSDEPLETLDRNSKEASSSANTVKKIVMVVESIDGRAVVDSPLHIKADMKADIIDDLIEILGVTSVQITDRHIQISYHDSMCGPRSFANALTRRGIVSSASTLGGFTSAEKMASQRDAETDGNKRAFLLALSLSVPLVFLSDVLPLIRPQDPMGILGVEVAPGVSAYALLLFVLCTPVQFGVGLRFHRKAYKSILAHNLGMDFLVSTGELIR